MRNFTPDSEKCDLCFSPPAHTIKFLLDYSKSLKVLKLQDEIPVKIHMN
jgi:hypothetical protein